MSLELVHHPEQALATERAGHERPRRKAGWAGLFLLLLLLVPGWLLRASYESSIWTDELYSLKMGLMPLEQMLDATTFDAHPPAYYVVLRGWLLLGQRLAGEEHQLLWARSLSVLGMIAFTVIAWFGARRLFSRQAGSLIAWLLAVNGLIQFQVRNLRNYALVLPALLLCFLILLWLWERDDDKSRQGQGPWWGAALYGFSAMAALYLHLLSAVVLALLGVAWLAMVIRRPGPTATPLRFGMATGQLLAALSFVPWLIQLRYQLRYLSSTPTPWMTPPDFGNLGLVFGYWIPWGTVQHLMTPARVVAGACAILLPVAVLLTALTTAGARTGEDQQRDVTSRNLLRAASLGIWVGVGFILLTWVITRLEIAKVFHAGRYSVLGTPMVLVALGAMAALAGPRFSSSRQVSGVITFALLLPLMILSIMGTVTSHRLEGGGGIVEAVHAAPAEMLPRDGEPLYLLGQELAPYLRQTLAPFDPRPIEDVIHLPATMEGVTILAPDLWVSIWPFRDRLARTMLLQGRAHVTHRQHDIWETMSLIRLEGIDHARWQEVFAEGTIQPRRIIPKNAVALALPESQLMAKGWSVIEVGEDFSTFRWGANRRMEIRFAGHLPPNRYRVHVEGYRQPFPEETVPYRVGLVHGGEEIDAGTLESGYFGLSFPLELQRSETQLALWIECPTWVPREHLDTVDSRQISFLFNLAWIEVAGD